MAIGHEVGVFDGAEADDAGDFLALRFGKIGVFFRDGFERALFGFVEQVGEFDGFAGAGLEGFAVVAENFAETDVGRAALFSRFGMPAAEGRETVV